MSGRAEEAWLLLQGILGQSTPLQCKQKSCGSDNDESLPRGLPTCKNALYHNNGDGTFTDVTRQSGIAAATETYGMTVVTADFDEDGWIDIFVASDSTPSLLFMNNRDGTFREEGVMRGVALSDDGMEQAGMGVGIGDYNLDGHLDPSLYANPRRARDLLESALPIVSIESRSVTDEVRLEKDLRAKV